jgi:trimeric autotransporter adhesin
MISSGRSRQSPCQKLFFLLIIIAGALQLAVPASASPGITAFDRGDGSYYLGEMIFFSGANTETNATSLFLMGPNLPSTGAKLTAPFEPVVSGHPQSFVTAPVLPDKTWGYTWFTAPLWISDGTYAIYAMNQSKTYDELAGADYYSVFVTLKKPYVTTDIEPPLVEHGRPLTIMGTAKDNPDFVQVWMFGDHYLVNAMVPVSSDSSYSFTVDPSLSGNFPEGQWYLVVQHPMQDHRFNVTLDGDWIRTTCNNGGSSLLIHGPGAAEGKSAAFSMISNGFKPGCNDDTYTVLPFVVSKNGITRGAVL